MMIRIFAILLASSLLVNDGEKDGRRGNELYAQQQFDVAAEAYEGGLATLSANAPRLLRYGLLNNLGAALLKSGDSEAAGEAFARALASAPGPPDVARTSYNAGNASFAAKDLEAALAHYRESLLADSGNEDAKYNYEFVKRQLDEQQQQQQQGGQPDNEQQQEDSEQEQAEGDQDPQEQEQEQEQEQGQQGAENDQQTDEQQENQEAQSDPAGEDETGQEPRQSPTELSEEEAERILQALQNEEEQLLRQVQRPKSRPRQVEKDW